MSPSAAAPAVSVVLVGAVAIGGVTWVTANSAERGSFPLRNVYQVRVLPYPDRVEWFAAQGMPQADLFLDLRRPPVSEAGQAPVLWVPEDDPVFEEWSAWLDTDGRRTFLLWAITHPSYLVREPMARPERTFNNAGGDLTFYTAPDQRAVPDLISLVMFPDTALAVGLAAALTYRGVRTHGNDGWVRREPAWLAGAVLVATALPHGVLAWHADGMETARHLVVPSVQLRLGVVLLAVGTVSAWVRPGGGVSDGGEVGRESAHG